MPSRNFVLTDHQQALIGSLVASGRYQSASDVLGEGLRLVEGRETGGDAAREALCAAVQIGVDDIERGAFIEFDDAEAMTGHLRSIGDEVLSRFPQTAEMFGARQAAIYQETILSALNDRRKWSSGKS